MDLKHLGIEELPLLKDLHDLCVKHNVVIVGAATEADGTRYAIHADNEPQKGTAAEVRPALIQAGVFLIQAAEHVNRR